MNRRLIKYAVVGGLLILVAVPTIAHSQRAAGRDAGLTGRRAGSTHAQRRGPGRRGPRGMGPRVDVAQRVLARADELGLDAEQQDAVRAAQRQYREASITRDADRRLTELELADLMRASTPDIETIESKLRELGDSRIDGQVAALRLDHLVRESLTAEQAEALEALPPRRQPRTASRPHQRGRPCRPLP